MAMTPPTVKFAQYVIDLYNGMALRQEEGKFVGSPAKLMDELGISRTYYQRAMPFLEDTGCITFLHRGGHNRGVTEILLHRPPTEEEISRWNLTSTVRPAIKKSTSTAARLTELESQVESLISRLEILEQGE